MHPSQSKAFFVTVAGHVSPFCWNPLLATYQE